MFTMDSFGMESAAFELSFAERVDQVTTSLQGVNFESRSCTQLLAEIHQAQILFDQTLLQGATAHLELIVQNGNIEDLYNNLAIKFSCVNSALGNILYQVVHVHLTEWKSEQRWSPDLDLTKRNLSNIQIWLQNIAELIVLTKDQVLQASNLEQSHALKWLHAIYGRFVDLPIQLDMLTNQLVQEAFIIEVQPSQVIKTNTILPRQIVVRQLVGGDFHIRNSSEVKVKVDIVTEEQARRLATGQSLLDDTLVEKMTISNNTAKLKQDPSYGFLSAKFEKSAVKEVKRDKASGREGTVTETKFSFVCYASFKMYGLEFKVWVISSPVILITHSNQELNAWATILWDNTFAQIHRYPFQVPTNGCWEILAQMMSAKFHDELGRGLTESDLNYLKFKAFRGVTTPGDILSWHKFAKEAMPEGKFSFSDWLFAVMNFIRKYLAVPWKNGYIRGFISRPDVEYILSGSNPGTFLLRFSDSVLGAVSVCWVREDGVVDHLSPFDSNDFDMKSIAEHMNDLTQFQWLFPDYIPKENVFSSEPKDPVVPLPNVRRSYAPRIIKSVIV